MDTEWYDFAVKRSSEGWRSSLRVIVESGRAMEELMEGGGDAGSLEVIILLGCSFSAYGLRDIRMLQWGGVLM